MKDVGREAFNFLIDLGLAPMTALGCVAKYSAEDIYDAALKVTRNGVNMRDRERLLLQELRKVNEVKP